MGVGANESERRKTMRLALLTGAAVAISLIGAAGAQAEMVYVTEPTVVEAPPAYGYYDSGYAYTAPAPVVAPPAPVFAAPPGYVVSEPRDYVVVTPPEPTYVRPNYVRPVPRYMPRRQVVINRPVSEDEIVTTGYSAHNCYIDLAGVERCF
jgi:hypothetical protein